MSSKLRSTLDFGTPQKTTHHKLYSQEQLLQGRPPSPPRLDSQLPPSIPLYVFVWKEQKQKNNWMRGEQARLPPTLPWNVSAHTAIPPTFTGSYFAAVHTRNQLLYLHPFAQGPGCQKKVRPSQTAVAASPDAPGTWLHTTYSLDTPVWIGLEILSWDGGGVLDHT